MCSLSRYSRAECVSRLIYLMAVAKTLTQLKTFLGFKFFCSNDRTGHQYALWVLVCPGFDEIIYVALTHGAIVAHMPFTMKM